MQSAASGAAATGGPEGLSIRTPNTGASPAVQQGGGHAGGAAGGGDDGGSITLKCSDASLGTVTHHRVTVQHVSIGANQALVWHCPQRRSTYAHVKDSEQCQQGQVRIVAKCKMKDDGTVRYVSPYQYFALKIQDKDRVAAQQARLSEGYGGDDTLLEKALMYNLSSHPHVARIVECWHEARNIYTVMEYVNGELLSRVSAGGAFDEATARHFFRQILAGVKALHDIGYCHRDLSLENVLVTDDDVAKLIDFGAAARLPPLSRVTAPDGSTSWVDTPLQPPATPFGKTAYMLPEYYHKLPYSGRQFDLWSAAVCLYIMLEGEYLYAAPSAADAKFMALHTGNFAGLFEARNTARAAAGRPPLSPALQDLLAGTLHPDPNARPHTVDVLLGHVWVSGSTPPPPPLSSTASTGSAGIAALALGVAGLSVEQQAALDALEDEEDAELGGQGGDTAATYIGALHAQFSAGAGAGGAPAPAQPPPAPAGGVFGGASSVVETRAGVREVRVGGGR